MSQNENLRIVGDGPRSLHGNLHGGRTTGLMSFRNLPNMLSLAGPVI